MTQDEILAKLDQAVNLLTEVRASMGVVQPTPDLPQVTETDPEDGGVSEEVVHESLVGKTGVFNGEFVVMDNGKKVQVPPNYASKSMLVVGDRLKLVEEGDINKFGLAGQVERVELEGILTKKDNLWVALVNDPKLPGGNHEFRVVSAAIRFHGGEFGDSVVVLLPKGYETSLPEWAAIKELKKSEENQKRIDLEAQRADGVKPVNPYAKPVVSKPEPVELVEPMPIPSVPVKPAAVVGVPEAVMAEPVVREAVVESLPPLVVVPESEVAPILPPVSVVQLEPTVVEPVIDNVVVQPQDLEDVPELR